MPLRQRLPERNHPLFMEQIRVTLKVSSNTVFPNIVSAKWTGREYITEYGSIVPLEVNDAIEAETTGKETSFVYGANTGDPEGQY